MNKLARNRLTIIFAIIVVIIAPISYKVFGASVNTSVTVGNSAPAFTVNPAESAASDGTTPWNVGTQYSFTATATDSNSENYYLAICKTNSVTAVNGGAPTCGGGNWCIGSSTATGVQASCNYTPVLGDAESNVWYGFVCDGNASSAACSSSNQGSGSSGSPFKVNHAPAFPTASNDGPKNPGASVTWSTTSGATDTDTDTVADTVKLVVCNAAGITAGDCTGGAGNRYCASSLVANNPSCAYSIPTPTSAGSKTAYVYVVDNHNLASGGAAQGTTSNFTVNNVAPVVSAVTLNGGSDITLTEGTTTAITVGATITDNNSCQDISTVTTSVYRSLITYTGCDIGGEANDNNCYAVVSCSVVGAGNTCTGSTDSSADYTCTVNMQYHADPTDASTQYTAQNWLNTVKATDGAAATATTEVSAGVEVNSLIGYTVTSSIAYGSLAVGQSNDPLDKITTVTNRGNVGLDEDVSGTDMDDGAAHTIGVAYQKYALAASTAYASSTALSTGATTIQLNCQKTVVAASPKTKDTYWGLQIPVGTVTGSYSGTNTIVAGKGDTGGW